MSQVETISATEFKAKCLELFDRLSGRELERLEVTKRGRVVAVILPPPENKPADDWIEQLQKRMKGMTNIPDDWDLTAPIFEGEFDPDPDGLHDR